MDGEDHCGEGHEAEDTQCGRCDPSVLIGADAKHLQVPGMVKLQRCQPRDGQCSAGDCCSTVLRTLGQKPRIRKEEAYVRSAHHYGGVSKPKKIDVRGNPGCGRLPGLCFHSQGGPGRRRQGKAGSCAFPCRQLPCCRPLCSSGRNRPVERGSWGSDYWDFCHGHPFRLPLSSGREVKLAAEGRVSG